MNYSKMNNQAGRRCPEPPVQIPREDLELARESLLNHLHRQFGTSSFLHSLPQTRVNGEQLAIPESFEELLPFFEELHLKVKNSPSDRVLLQVGEQTLEIERTPVGMGLGGTVYGLAGSSEVLKIANPNWYGLHTLAREAVLEASLQNLVKREHLRIPRILDATSFPLFVRRERIFGTPLTDILLRTGILQMRQARDDRITIVRAGPEEVRDRIAHSPLLQELWAQLTRLFSLRKAYPELVSDLGPDNLLLEYGLSDDPSGNGRKHRALILVDVGPSASRTRKALNEVHSFEDYVSFSVGLANRYLDTGVMAPGRITRLLGPARFSCMDVSGSFDPPTVAHKTIITETAKRFGIDRAVVLVNFTPHKDYHASVSERTKLVRAMLQDLKLKISVQMRPLSGRRSHLESAARSSRDPVLVVFGEDVLERNMREFGGIPNVHYVVIRRKEGGSRRDLLELYPEVDTWELPLAGISSMRVREAIARGEDPARLLDPKVLALIQKEQLFRPLPDEEIPARKRLFEERFLRFRTALHRRFPDLELTTVSVDEFRPAQSDAGRIDRYLQDLIQQLGLPPADGGRLLAEARELFEDLTKEAP